VRWVCPALAAALALPAAADPLGDGYAWLRSRQDARGAFGASTGENELVATHEALEAFAAAAQSQSPEAENARLFVALSHFAAANELNHRRGMALAGTAFSFTPPVDFAHADGFEALDAWAAAWTLLEANRNGGAGRPEVRALARELAGLVAPSGCLAVADNEDVIELSALVSRSLRPFAAEPGVAGARSALLACLVTKQQPGGGFGDVPATASAALAFLEGGASFATALAAARGYLLASQSSDGSFGGVRATALALQTLGDAPDWRFPLQVSGRSLFSLSAFEVNRGEPVTAFLDIVNASASAAPATTVRVSARPSGGGAEVVLGDFGVPALAAGAATRVSAPLSTASLNGRYELVATVDPLLLFAELDRTNNSAVAALNVRADADFALTSTSIRFTAAGPSSVSIEVTVRSLGAAAAVPSTVDVWKGAPVSGTLLGSFTVPAGLSFNQSFTGSISTSTAGLSGFTAVWARADAADAVPESDETNNAAVRFYEQGAESPVDVGFFAGDVPSVSARVNVPVDVSGVVRNFSSFDANRVLLVAKNGQGQRIAAVELASVPRLSVTPFTLRLSFPSAQTHSFTVEADPDGALNDTSRSNNAAASSASVSNGANIRLASVANSNADATGGTPVLIRATVQNQANVILEAILELTELSTPGALTRLRVQLAPSESREVVLGSYPTPPGPGVFRVCADPEGLLDEDNENDNCAETETGTASFQPRLASRDISLSPVGAEIGEAVHATAVVRNANSTPGACNVEWWQGPPGRARSRLLGTTAVQVPGNGSATTSFDFVRGEGVPEVFVRTSGHRPRSGNTTPLLSLAGRHFFLEDIVDVVVPPSVTTRNEIRTVAVRSGRLDPLDAVPELAVLYRDNGTPPHYGLAVLGRGGDGHYAVRWRFELPASPDYVLHDVVLLDVDNDGDGEVVLMTSTNNLSSVPKDIQIHVFAHDGTPVRTMAWSTALTGVFEGAELGLGDLNGDGLVEVVTSDDTLRAFTLATGAPVLAAPLPFVANVGSFNPQTKVVDVDGDGQLEIFSDTFTATQGRHLYSASGTQLWIRSGTFGIGNVALADLELDGLPDGAEPFGDYTELFTLSSPSTIRRTPAGPFDLFEQNAVGALRQDGRPYVLGGLWGRLQPAVGVTAFSGDFKTQWLYDTTPPGQRSNNQSVEAVVTLADVMGLGRPQVIVSQCADVLHARRPRRPADSSRRRGEHRLAVQHRLQRRRRHAARPHRREPHRRKHVARHRAAHRLRQLAARRRAVVPARRAARLSQPALAEDADGVADALPGEGAD